MLSFDPLRGQRVAVIVAHHGAHDAHPPGALLIQLARARKVMSRTLLGFAPRSHKTSPKVARFVKCFRRVA